MFTSTGKAGKSSGHRTFGCTSGGVVVVKVGVTVAGSVWVGLFAKTVFVAVMVGEMVATCGSGELVEQLTRKIQTIGISIFLNK